MEITINKIKNIANVAANLIKKLWVIFLYKPNSWTFIIFILLSFAIPVTVLKSDELIVKDARESFPFWLKVISLIFISLVLFKNL